MCETRVCTGAGVCVCFRHISLITCPYVVVFAKVSSTVITAHITQVNDLNQEEFFFL